MAVGAGARRGYRPIGAPGSRARSFTTTTGTPAPGGFLVAMRPTRRSGRGAAEVAGHLQDIALGGATSTSLSGLLQGRLVS